MLCKATQTRSGANEARSSRVRRRARIRTRAAARVVSSQTLRSRGLENQRKKDEGQEQLDLDKMKAMMNKEIQEDKLEQNEQLAGLRAGVSLAKQQMSDASKIHDFGRNFPKK